MWRQVHAPREWTPDFMSACPEESMIKRR